MLQYSYRLHLQSAGKSNLSIGWRQRVILDQQRKCRQVFLVLLISYAKEHRDRCNGN